MLPERLVKGISQPAEPFGPQMMYLPSRPWSRRSSRLDCEQGGAGENLRPHRNTASLKTRPLRPTGLALVQHGHGH